MAYIQPVEEHVEAVFWDVVEPYPPRVATLRSLGDLRQADVQELRCALGLRQEDVKALVAMSRDRSLHLAHYDSPDVYAPIHAVFALLDLDVREVVDQLVPLLDLDDEDLYLGCLEQLLANAGPAALDPLLSYLADPTRWSLGHAMASSALQRIAAEEPKVHGRVIAGLRVMLKNLASYSPESCSTAIAGLMHLDEREALPLIRQAFEAGKVVELDVGDWGAVLRHFGITPHPGDPVLAMSFRRLVALEREMIGIPEITFLLPEEIRTPPTV